jgi:hypothetical protein
MHKVYINYVYDIHNSKIIKLLNKNMNSKPRIAIRARAGAETDTWNGRILNLEYVRALYPLPGRPAFRATLLIFSTRRKHANLVWPSSSETSCVWMTIFSSVPAVSQLILFTGQTVLTNAAATAAYQTALKSHARYTNTVFYLKQYLYIFTYFAMKCFVYLNVQSRKFIVNKGSRTYSAYKRAFNIIKKSKDENEGQF